jgi:hypothetical protein
MLKAPPVPAAIAAPDPIEIEPVVPELDVPELNWRRPLTPFVPALEVRMLMAPLVVALLSPLVTPTAPPVETVLSPAAMSTPPPTPLSPVPTPIWTVPPFPPVAGPEPINTDPVVPELDVPELNVRRPLTPFVPAFEVRIEIEPLDVARPRPLSMPTAPPVSTVLSPADRPKEPPVPLKPVPTAMRSTPPEPPLVTCAAPEPIEIEPVVPELDVPDLNDNSALTPLSPALEVRIVMAPVVLARPKPDVTPIAPPVVTVLCPDVTVIRPPAPLLPLPTVMLTAPPLPPVEAPDPIEIEPVVPELDVPELNDSRPLTPPVPAFAELIVITPLVLATPWPLTAPIAPPVCTVLSPAAKPTIAPT